MRYPVTTFKRHTRAGDVNTTVDGEALSRLREVFLIMMIAVFFAYTGITFYLHWHRLYEGGFTVILKLTGFVIVFATLDFLLRRVGQGGLLGNWFLSLFPSSDPVITWVIAVSLLLSGISFMTRFSWYHLSISL